MNDLALTITDLKTKVEKLMNLHQLLKQDNERLVIENTSLSKTISEQTNKIDLLEKNNQELEKNKEDEQNKIITDTKSKINELVQEIDQCIALLK